MTISFVSVQHTVYRLSNFNEIIRKMPPDCQRNLDSYLSPVTLSRKDVSNYNLLNAVSINKVSTNHAHYLMS